MPYWCNWFSWWWAQGCSKHVEYQNKHIRKELCVNLVIYKNCTEMHGQQNYLQELYRDARPTKLFTRTIPRCTANKIIYKNCTEARSTKLFTRIVPRCTVNKIIYKNCTEMHGQQNTKFCSRINCTVKRGSSSRTKKGTRQRWFKQQTTSMAVEFGFSAASSTLLCPVQIPRQIAQQNTPYVSF